MRTPFLAHLTELCWLTRLQPGRHVGTGSWPTAGPPTDELRTAGPRTDEPRTNGPRR